MGSIINIILSKVGMSIPRPTRPITTKIASNLEANNIIGTGSGIVISNNGYIITNNHVVENGKIFDIRINDKTYKADLIKTDKTNDFAILKINDKAFVNFTKIPFVIKNSTLSIGTKVFTLGFPQTEIQGKGIKLTDGIISSKTGYQDDPVCYQISCPIQPGNSGGPLFDMNGSLVGIVNAGIPGANSVGYSIKSTYLLNFLDIIEGLPELSKVTTLTGKTLSEQSEILTKYCVLITVKN
jgi:serine protease Do